ncbi:MAG: DEAD/DEAH box helicase family protein [Deltaproteobacteria bacterium]|jgi:predicted helicase|nr:DEAD/DEAH box helicase family protein [Deltaproteobacteria bacterium]
MSLPDNQTSLNNLLAEIRRKFSDNRSRGTAFENLIQAYFRTEPFYKERYSRVQSYSEWAQERGLSGQDLGIDLVAELAGESGKFAAIQCKFYAPGASIQRSNIDSFLAESGRPEFVERYLVITGSIASNAQATLDGQAIQCSLIDLMALGSSQVDWSRYSLENPVVVLRPKKEARPHQKKALENIQKGFAIEDRGILLMACASGKTLVSLKVAEKMAGPGGQVLFLVPSLALLSQVLTEWTQQTLTPIHSFAVCSDAYIGRINRNPVDDFAFHLHELQFPATTKPQSLVNGVKARKDANSLTVIFSTYQSIEVLSEAQTLGLPEFDLVICDEAHRTTGSKVKDDDESAFVRIHNNDFIKAKKRLYMTATPRIYAVNENRANTSSTDTVVLYSMDDRELFGPVFHSLTFSEAVKADLLVDYKVLVLSIDESLINRKVKLLTDADNALVVSDAAKIVGCFKALAKHGVKEDLHGLSLSPMKRAVAFCQVIDSTGRTSGRQASHKVSSKLIADMFSKVVEDYIENSPEDKPLNKLKCVAFHVDGTMNANEKSKYINWLREEPAENECRILTNVRCISEGIDVPALDAVLFLSPRKSMVEVVQSVGRVMRKAPNKDVGYVVLPVVLPAGVEPHKALDDNKTYKVVWDVLQALRSHDDRFDSWINKLELLDDTSGKIDFITFFEARGKSSESGSGDGPEMNVIGQPTEGPVQQVMSFEEDESFRKAIIVKLVKKVGNPDFLSEWADDVVRIAQTYIDRIKAILEDPNNTKEIETFNSFAMELRDDLNDSLTDAEVIEMLAQHMITGPAFNAIFENSEFIKQNSVSIGINKVLQSLAAFHLEKEGDGLNGFYDSVRKQVEDMRDKVTGLDNIPGKQKIIVELYDKFFRRAFPKMTQRLGIVYTPVEVVDFIIHSVNDLLRSEFDQNLSSRNVHIIDPFTGTGTFLTRLMQSGLIDKEDLIYKYNNEFHANELVLLAYYIASVNIESVYHDIVGGKYQPFPGICLTDTFQLHEKDDLISRYLVDNSTRRMVQKLLPLRVFISNPPYSVGQRSENDSNKNIGYPNLDKRIHDTYAANSSAHLLRGTRDNYVRAFRWASDRLKDETDGIIAFVTNSGFLNKAAFDGLRKCFAQDFQSIYALDLRGDVRKNMLSGGEAKEGENIFGQASMTGVAVTFLVKNSKAKGHCRIYYHDIGDNLGREQKLQKVKEFGSISGVLKANLWREITPDAKNDWLKQRDTSFSSFIILGDKRDQENKTFFSNYSLGLSTYRDAWCYNSFFPDLAANMEKSIAFYNQERSRFHHSFPNLKRQEALKKLESFLDNDSTKISWSGGLKQSLVANKTLSFSDDCIIKSIYRPFTKRWLYFHRDMNDRVYQMPSLFPSAETKNQLICVPGVGSQSGFFSTLATDLLPNFHFIHTTQCFPLYYYEPIDHDRRLFSVNDPDLDFDKRQAITSECLKLFQETYPKLSIKRLDIFHYIYGLLHSREYQERFADNLLKETPRIPLVKKAKDFQALVEAGRALGNLHIHYDEARKYPLDIVHSGPLTDKDYYVTQMKLKKSGKDTDLSTIVYNSKITLKGIPLKAYKYTIRGRAAINWVVQYQGVRQDKDSGIIDDANHWDDALENPKYPLELLQRVITVSLETLDIIDKLPKLDI